MQASFGHFGLTFCHYLCLKEVSCTSLFETEFSLLGCNNIVFVFLHLCRADKDWLIHDTFATFVHDDIDTDCGVQNGSTQGYVFKYRF